MNIEIKASGHKKWSLNDSYILYGKNTIINFEDIKKVIHAASLFPGITGTITLHLYGKLSPITLHYPFKQRIDGEHAANIIENKAITRKNYPKEYRKKCAVCGTVFCYTSADLEKNQANQTLAAISSLRSLSASMSGSSYHKYEQDKKTQTSLNKIVDYNRCPKCNSADVFDITNEPIHTNSNDNTSSLEELKKLKELLDLDIITKEEFEKKKKQILKL